MSSDPEAPRPRLSRGWAITLIIVVLGAFVGIGAVAAISFVGTLNSTPQQVTCTVTGTTGAIDSAWDERSEPEYSIETENVGDARQCGTFAVGDADVRALLEVGRTYAMTVRTLVGYTIVDAATVTD